MENPKSELPAIFTQTIQQWREAFGSEMPTENNLLKFYETMDAVFDRSNVRFEDKSKLNTAAGILASKEYERGFNHAKKIFTKTRNNE